MNDVAQLHADNFTRAVQTMRDAQKQLSPGCPLALRRAAQVAEREVDELLAVRLLWTSESEAASPEHSLSDKPISPDASAAEGSVQ